MTTTELKSYLTYIARKGRVNIRTSVSEKFPDDGLSDFLDFCIRAGLNDFWYAKPWSFACRSYTVPITSSSSSFELPDDFRGVRTARETSISGGRSLTYKTQEEFDRLIPDPSAYGSSYPEVFKITRDSSTQKWYIWFYPIPSSGMVVPLEILTKCPSVIDVIPVDYENGIVLASTRYMFDPSEHRSKIVAEYELKKAELWRNDTPFKAVDIFWAGASSPAQAVITPFNWNDV